MPYKSIDDKRANDRLRAAKPEEKERQRQKKRALRVRQDSTAILYRQNERIRNAKRHNAGWHYHDAVIVVCDGEADDQGNYKWLQMRANSVTYTLKPLPNESINFTKAAYWALNLRRNLRKEYATKHVYFYWFAFGYDMDQLIGHDAYINREQRRLLIKHRSKDFGLIRGKNWTNEVLLPNSRLAVHNGRKEVQIRFLKTDRGGELLYDDKGIAQSYAQLSHYDVYTLSAQSFLTLMKDMQKVWTEAEHATFDSLLELVKIGKAARGTFAEAGLTTEDILRYNEAELILLEWYMHKLVALCESDAVKLAPRTFAGPAPLARALLTKYGVTEHIKPEEYDTLAYQHSNIFRMVKRGYYGGNIQLAGWGHLESFWLYDIRSAYPTAITKLPCLAHGKWRIASECDVEAANAGEQIGEYGIWRIQWKCTKRDRFCPFPYRRKDGSIYYPLSGIGCYHSPEVSEYIANGRGSYRIIAGIIWQPECECKRPFDKMVRDTYTERAKLRESGDAAQLVLKLALNSVYGIFAQRSGSHLIVDEQGQPTAVKTPKFSNLYAAGYITSYTRARLYGAYCRYPDDVFGFATDSVYSFNELSGLPLGTSLGMWEVKHIQEPTAFVAPGVVLSANESYQRTRGMPPTDKMYELIEQARANGNEYFRASGKHYVDLRIADMPNTTDQWGIFAGHTRKLAVDGKALHTKRDWLRQTDVNGLHICASYLGVDTMGESYDIFKSDTEQQREKEVYDA